MDSGIRINWRYRQSKIYGAGLLSSVGESKHCLTDAVEKVPFSIEACTSTTYDVTKMQPQLFVCKSFEELTEALEKFAETMAFKTGGKEGLEKQFALKTMQPLN